ncbi:cytochrome oxidase assembly protein-domain-containing protein [Haematococcus lacustris]
MRRLVNVVSALLPSTCSGSGSLPQHAMECRTPIAVLVSSHQSWLVSHRVAASPSASASMLWRSCSTRSAPAGLKHLTGAWGKASLDSAACGLVGLMGPSAAPTGSRLAALWQLARHKSTAAGQILQAGKSQSGEAGAVLAGLAVGRPAALLASEALVAGVSPVARRQLMWWLGGTAAWVYTMVVLGGVTRLTRSGLSMTDWKFAGERPPLSQADWEAEFGRYQASPEFKRLHSRMTLDEFKFIFWMEYAHRMWGRLLGLAFVVPGAYFAARGYINAAMAKRLGLLLFMGGTQGLVGWWMVRSGLQEPEHEWQQPRVSPYRLAAHLVSAFAIFTTLTWTTLDLWTPTPLLRSMPPSAQPVASRARLLALPFAALVAVTATSGAFVAGLDAGHAYNEWPTMDGQLVPHQYWQLWEQGFGLRNFFENTAAVQFNHRTLATTTAAAALGLWAWSHSQTQLPRRAQLAMNLVAAATVAQFSLGVWTLLAYVPVHLGSAHQANALNLFTAVLITLHALRPGSAGLLPATLGPWVTPAAMASVAGLAVAVTRQQ